MSINNILELLKKYWSAFAMGALFLILGIVTVIGMLIYIPHIGHSTLGYLVILIGMVIGVMELVESFRLLRIPFKNK